MVILLVYVYFGYPLILMVIARRGSYTHYDDNYLPSVSLVIAAYNEEKVIREKLENSINLDYPREKMEIVVASDGSTDDTNAIVQSFSSKGVTLYPVIPRGGKTRALNLVVPRTNGDILVLSDANTMYQPDSIRKLVRNFADPSVGAVSGDVKLVDAADSYAESESLYYRYERWLQRLESCRGSIIGADGAMYAVARSCFRPPSDTIILDDFVISMNVARLGYRVVYEPLAVGVEEGTQSGKEEFRRKVRIVAGGMQALKLGEGLPRICQSGLLFCYTSHKLLRWFVPFFLLLIFCSALLLVEDPFYRFVLWAQLGLYCSAAVYAVLSVSRWQAPRLTGVPFYFCLVNGAAFLGVLKGLLRPQTGIWQRTRR